MTITAQVDVLAAVSARLKTFTEITGLTTSGRIAGEIGADWFTVGDQADYAILLRRTGGPSDADLSSVGIRRSRLDVTCYGASTKKAMDLMSYVLAALCPVQGVGQGSFTQAVGSTNVRVYSVAQEVDVITDRDPEKGWRFAWCPMIVQWHVISA